MNRHSITIVTVGTKQSYNAEGAMKVARGFHETAALLEKIHKQDLISVPKNTTLDLDIINQIMGRITSATVLEALALELILKARLVV